MELVQTLDVYVKCLLRAWRRTSKRSRVLTRYLDSHFSELYLENEAAATIQAMQRGVMARHTLRRDREAQERREGMALREQLERKHKAAQEALVEVSATEDGMLISSACEELAVVEALLAQHTLDAAVDETATAKAQTQLLLAESNVAQLALAAAVALEDVDAIERAREAVETASHNVKLHRQAQKLQHVSGAKSAQQAAKHANVIER